MKISIVIPVYNGEKYILKCLDSLKNQTFSPIEIIIVNDGSTDRTGELLECYAVENPGMEMKIINKQNAGLPQARKTGVEESQGDYIGFLDADDWVEPYIYSEMIAKAIEENADVVCCGYEMDYTNRQETVSHKVDVNRMYSGIDALEYLHRRIAIFPYAWNKIYRKKLLNNIKYPKGNFVGEDYTIMVQILESASSVCVVPEAGYHYIQVPNSMCRGGYNKSYVYAFQNYEKICQRLCLKYPQRTDAIRNYMITEYMAMIVAMGKNETYNEKMIKSIQKFVRKNLHPFLRSKDVPVVMKGSAIAVVMNYRFLILVYNLTARLTNHYMREKA